jgi:hypothetical protein
MNGFAPLAILRSYFGDYFIYQRACPCVIEGFSGRGVVSRLRELIEALEAYQTPFRQPMPRFFGAVDTYGVAV